MPARHLLVIAGILLASPGLWGQELEPRAYLVTPVGTNAVTITYERATGDALFDPSLPIEGARGTINTSAISYYRSLSFFSRSANLTLTVPYRFGTIKGAVFGESAQVYRSGMASPAIRFAWNLLGAPAMNRKEFSDFRYSTTLGFSLKVLPPLGQYDPNHAINVTTNRWSVKPEFGLIQPLGKRQKWFAEMEGGIWLFTTNNDYFGGKTRQQDPIWSVQFHLIRILRRRAWVAFDANGYYGGRTTVNGTERLDLQKNSRVGGTFGYILNRHQALKVSVNMGAYTVIGQKFTTVSIGYQYFWGGRR